MSAFIPMPEHIGLLAAAAVNFKATTRTLDDVAELLAREVIASVAYRYPADTGNGDRPGPCLPDEQIVQAAVVYGEFYADHFPDWFNAKDLRNLARCYVYQACEHPDWPQSEAMVLLARLPGACKKLGPEHIRWEFVTDEPLPEVEAMYEEVA